jgi:hypothetical protein
MRQFELHRDTDETGISGTGIVAQGVQFDDGTACLRWMSAHTSTACYASMTDVEAIHGHAGKTRIVWTGNAFQRGFENCVQDSFENCPFLSAGGIDARPDLKAPPYISTTDVDAYLAGYRASAELMHGADWTPVDLAQVEKEASNRLGALPKPPRPDESAMLRTIGGKVPR